MPLGEKDRVMGAMTIRLGRVSPLTVKGTPHPWVSRGGLKLAHALEYFHIDPAGKVCIDVGASTGGFTDVLLQNGAARVYAVDVGHGQLAWKLRSDDRVTVLEKTNARYLSDEQIPEPADMVVCDASYSGILVSALGADPPAPRVVILAARCLSRMLLTPPPLHQKPTRQPSKRS